MQTHPEECNGKYSELELKLQHVPEEYFTASLYSVIKKQITFCFDFFCFKIV